MRILSNGFPTNLPKSETISQGGPANFARLFFAHILNNNLEHHWTGVMLESTQSNSCRLYKDFANDARQYFRLRTSKSNLRKVLQATSSHVKPEVVWRKEIARLATLIKANQTDVVFLNGFGTLNWMLLKAAESANTPVVIQHAGIWNRELDIHKDLYSKHGLDLMKKMECDSTRLSRVEIFLNTWSKEYYRKNVAPKSEDETAIVPLPFNFGAFRNSETKSAPKHFNFDKKLCHIGIIARWDDIKNHKAVLAFAKEAKRRNLPWQFHSIVEIPDRKEYKKTREEYAKYVDICTPVDRTGIAEFCKVTDLLLLPSIFDVSPTVVLEAVATNTPVVISKNVGYVHDFYTCGAGDWVIDTENTKKAVDHIAHVMKKPMSNALRRHIRLAHDHTKVFTKYLEIFKEVSEK